MISILMEGDGDSVELKEFKMEIVVRALNDIVGFHPKAENDKEEEALERFVVWLAVDTCR